MSCRPWVRSFCSLYAVLVVGLLSSVAQAAPPPNDDCANAIQVIPNVPISGTNAEATGTNLSSCASTSDTNDVWYVYAADLNGTATASLCGGTPADFDTTIAIFDSCGGTELRCDDDGCGGFHAMASFDVVAGEDYFIRVAGFNSGDSGPFMLSVNASPTGGVGPDVIYGDVEAISSYTPQGGIRAYSLSSHTCNIGDMTMPWNSTQPLLGMNAYRLHAGRIEQIGMSWLKNATTAAASTGCGPICSGPGGSQLGAGCLDVYSSGFNGGQGILGPRSACNAFTGSYPGPSGGSGNSIYKRLQVAESDLDEDNFPGALYLVEGVYVCTSDAAGGNAMNNASYKRVNVNQTTFALTPAGVMHATIPAMYAWRDHGLGVDTPDPSVIITTVDVPSEGRFYLGHKSEDLGGGNWRYTYAVFNLNSHRSGGSFTVPVPAGVEVDNVGFHDVNYHSGEPFDNTDWTGVENPDNVTWSSPQTFDENPDSNALRFGTMYTFWFDAKVAPGPGEITLGLFRTGSPDSVTAAVPVPGGCPGDCVTDRLLNGDDINEFVACLLGAGCACSDMDGNGTTDAGDVNTFTAALVSGAACP